MKIENLKAEYMDDKLTYEFLHNGKVVEGCIPKVHYRASFYDVQQVEETYDTNTTTSYTFTKGTNIEGLHIQVFLMDIVDGKTCVVESLIKLTVKNDWDGDLATTSLIPHIKTQTYVSLETNPNNEVVVEKDYKLKAEYIDGGVTINVKHPGGEYVKKFDDIRQELFNKFIVQTKHIQTGYDETKYRRYWETEHGKLLLVIFDVKNPATDTIEESFVKVYFTNNNIAIETSLIPHTSSPTTNPTKETKMHDGIVKFNGVFIRKDFVGIDVSIYGSDKLYLMNLNHIKPSKDPVVFPVKIQDIRLDFTIEPHDMLTTSHINVKAFVDALEIPVNSQYKYQIDTRESSESSYNTNVYLSLGYEEKGIMVGVKNLSVLPIFIFIRPDEFKGTFPISKQVDKFRKLSINQITNGQYMVNLIENAEFLDLNTGKMVTYYGLVTTSECIEQKYLNKYKSKEVVVEKDYKLKAEYIDGGVTINVKHPGGEYVKKFDDIRQELFNKPIAVSKRNQTGYEETSYRLNWMTEPGFHLSMLVLDLENQCTGKIDLTYLKVYLITNEVNVIETGLIPHTSSSSTNPTGEQKMNKDSTQDKYHDGGSFADDENFHEEPIEPDTSPNGDLASLEAKVDKLTELVKHQHRVITHIGDKMSILPPSYHHPATPYYPNFVPPEFGQHMPQPPLSPNGFGTTPPTHSFNPQQPPVGYYPPSGMGQGLYSNPSHQPDQPNNTSNSVLGQMNGLNQRLKAQQQPTATKEEIKDQPNFRSNFPK